MQMSWKTCWTTVLCALLATVLIELTTHSFSRNLTLQTALNLTFKQSAPSFIRNTPSSASTTNKPWFLLHVGPPKTTTTTLQVELAKLNSSRVLEKDDYLYIGRDSRFSTNSPEFGTRIHQILTNTTCHVQVRAARVSNSKIVPECWIELRRLLKGLSSTETHVICSDERFGFIDSKLYYDWQAIHDLFIENWNLQVIVSYRRYFEWIVSVKSQQYRESSQTRTKWPDTVGGAPPVPPLYESLQLWKHNPQPYKYLYTNVLLQKLKRFNVSTNIFNLHHLNNNKTLLSTFACHVLPHAHFSCLVTSANNTETRSNVALNTMAYDGIACQARELGYVNTLRYPRPAVATLALEFHETILDHTKLPLICPNKLEFLPLLQQSMDYEQQILPEFFQSPLGKTTLEHDFWKTVQHGKFCSVNATAVLQQDVWRKFFRNL